MGALRNSVSPFPEVFLLQILRIGRFTLQRGLIPF